MKKKEREENANDGELRYVPAVDGGWGWVVVVGSFFIHVFADGIVYSFGILLEKIMKEFGASNAKASVIISLLTGLTLGCGPIASAITNKFGCRFTTILGSLTASFGCAASYYATSVEYLMVSVGCIMGIGFGLMYCPAIVIVTMYFEKKRAMATGIAVCGAGVGTFLFAPISEELVKAFSWQTVFAVYSGVVLLCSICGATFRPLKFIAVDDLPQKADEELENDIEKKKIDQTENKLIMMTSAKSRTGSQQSLGEKDADGKIGLLDIKDGCKRSRTVSESTGFITVKDVFYTGSISNLETATGERHRSLITLSTDEIEEIKQLRNEATNVEKKGNKPRELLKTIERMTDISLLAEPIFLLYAVSNLLTSIAFNSPLIFLPAHATNLGCTPSESAKIVSSFGLMNTLGRIVVGLVSDRKLPFKFGKDLPRNRLWFYILSLTACGLLTACVFLCDNFITLAIYSGLFGLTLSSYVCLTSVILVDFIGIEKLTNAFGLILLFQGIGTVFGPPIAGRLADLSGSYDASFLFCGISLIISGVMLVAVPRILSQKKKREKQNSNEKS